jgi:hypothetical protein
MKINLVIAILVGGTFLAGMGHSNWLIAVPFFALLFLSSLYRLILYDIPSGYVSVNATYYVAHLMGQITALLVKQPDPSRMPVYLASSDGIHPMSGMFLARLNGERALVLEQSERSTEEEKDITAWQTDL